FTDPPAAERQIELILGVLDAWMAAHLGNTSGPAARPSQASPAELVSWVSVEW
ncbi:TetR family transcriptional regulator, partial [Rhodococcus sp. ACPA1]